MGRYALIGEAMRAERPAIASRDFASKVMAAIARSRHKIAVVATVVAPPHFSGRASLFAPGSRHGDRRRRRGRGVFGHAAAGTIATWKAASATTALIAANEPAAEPRRPATQLRRADVDDPAPRSFRPTRLTNYVVAHSEYSSPLGRRSVLTGVLADDEDVTARKARTNRPRFRSATTVLRYVDGFTAHNSPQACITLFAAALAAVSTAHAGDRGGAANGWSACREALATRNYDGRFFHLTGFALGNAAHHSIASTRARSPSGWCRSTAAAVKSSATKPKSSATCPTDARCWWKSAPTTTRCSAALPSYNEELEAHYSIETRPRAPRRWVAARR